MSAETDKQPSLAEAPDSTTAIKDVEKVAVSESAGGNPDGKTGSSPAAGDEGNKAGAGTDEEGGEKSNPSKRSPNKRSPGKRNTSAQRAAIAAALADPEALLEFSSVDEVTKQTQCSIPFQRSTFMQLNPNSGEAESKLPPTKASVRSEVWSQMESTNVAAFPRPVYRRIPNFKEAALACNAVAELDQFKNAQNILIGPDRPQQNIRVMALEQGKTLLIPTSRMEDALFVKITPPEDATKDQLNLCAATEGFKKFGSPVPIDEKLKIDLVIVGSVAVSSSGRRLGKGEGFADLEWAMLREIEAVDKDTVVITSVHDSQLKDDMPTEIFTEMDVTVDIIATPTQTIPVREPLPKPNGLIWSRIPPERLEKVPVLKKLREKAEAAGKDVTLGESLKKDSISRIEPGNEIDKCIQTMGGSRRRAKSLNRKNNKKVQSKHNAKVKGIRKERNNRSKSLNEDEEAGKDGEVDPVKKAKQRRNKARQQRSLKNRNSVKSDGEPENTDSGKGETSGDEKPPRRRRANKKTAEGGRGDAGEERQQSGGKRRGGGRGNFPPPPPGRFAPPWLHPYGAPPPPPGRYGGYYPPPPPGGRYMYRNAPPVDEFGYEDPGFYGPPGRRNGPPGAFYPSRRPAVYVGDIPKDCGEDMFNDMLIDRKVRPYRLIWQQDENRTFLVFDNIQLAKDCLRKLRNLSINDEPCRVDLSNMTKRNYFQ